MSYEIIKSIKIRDNKVFIKGASNNVRPRDFSREWECPSLSKILQEQGHNILDLEILKAYEEGNFQRGSNKYTRALAVLRHFPEYKSFDWRGDNDENRRSPAFNELLVKALNSKLPKDKFIITKNYFGKLVYLWKKTKHYASWHSMKDKAKIFNYETDADFMKHCFTNSDDWIIEQIQ